MVRRRQRMKVPLGDRRPLVRPSRSNEVWSVDFVFDRLADGGSLKCFTVVDDCTHEAVAVHPDRAMSGVYVTRILDRDCNEHRPKKDWGGLPPTVYAARLASIATPEAIGTNTFLALDSKPYCY
jgi:transposase InsO family protein